MATMNLGSVATQILSLVEDVPATISGAILLDLIDRKRLFMETYTGQSIGSVGIAEVYQPPLFNLSVAELLRYMNIIGVDNTSISLGDFSESKGGQSDLIVSSEYYETQGMEALKSIGRGIRWTKVNG